MFVPVQCSFCNQTFDFDSSSGILQADCPHCGKQNTVILPDSGKAKDMTIQHDAPSLAGAKPCPSCKSTVARDAVICIHCGYNFQTRQKPGGGNWLARNKGLAIGGGIGILAAIALLAFLFWPEAAPPPPYVPPAESTAQKPEPTPPPEPTDVTDVSGPSAATDESAEAEEPVEPDESAEPEAPPPEPAPEELAAQQAEAERAAREAARAEFEAKKARAEETLRMQLETREPMHRLGETVELRRKNGLVDKGELQRYAGSGTGRVAIIAAAHGEVGVPLVALDPASRRRMDQDYREAFIAHVLSTRLPDPDEPFPAE